jgi:hypothetical protein
MNKADELSAMMGGVDVLAMRMKQKLRRKAREGRSGGLDTANRRMVAKLLSEHVRRFLSGDEQEQAIDVCNLAMMLWVMDGSQE